MPDKKKEHPAAKDGLHPRNKHRVRYDFGQLKKSYPVLNDFTFINQYQDETIDFANPRAVLALNKALLLHYYHLEYWDIPHGYLCPPIPGRADYIHYASDLLAGLNGGVVPTGSKIRCFDVGVGANCIYPILGHQEYGWSFIGSDTDQQALASAQKIIDSNEHLKMAIELRLQANQSKIFEAILMKDETIDVVFCNPPFHASRTEANAANFRKLSNLNKKDKSIKKSLNFGGQSNELWFPGGELQFIYQIIHESKELARSVLWFTTLISKKTNEKPILAGIKKAGAVESRIIKMEQGNKISRLAVWSFIDRSSQEKWLKDKNIK